MAIMSDVPGSDDDDRYDDDDDDHLILPPPQTRVYEDRWGQCRGVLIESTL